MHDCKWDTAAVSVWHRPEERTGVGSELFDRNSLYAIIVMKLLNVLLDYLKLLLQSSVCIQRSLHGITLRYLHCKNVGFQSCCLSSAKNT